MIFFMLVAGFGGWAAASRAQAGEFTGSVNGEVRYFPQAPVLPEQHGTYTSVAMELEYREKWDGDRQSFTFIPFGRLDQYDAKRSHADVRELMWTRIGDDFDLRAGIGKVFWGVTEFAHLVDVINQTDLVESPEGKEKLGQPMLNLGTQRSSWGALNAFVLPRFRERTFPGPEGRLQLSLPVDTSQTQYESGKGRNHTDWALRWSYTGAVLDLGLYRFAGTDRDPQFVPGQNGAGQAVLIPRYNLIERTGLDLQATFGPWLWKLEAIEQSQPGSRFSASTGGLEYTIVGILGSRTDLGLLAEYMHDGRGNAAPGFFQDDVGFGLRLALNDEQSTQVLLGAIFDRDTDSQAWKLEASRRLGEKWKLGFESRVFRKIDPQDVLFGMRKDSYLQLNLARYF